MAPKVNSQRVREFNTCFKMWANKRQSPWQVGWGHESRVEVTPFITSFMAQMDIPMYHPAFPHPERAACRQLNPADREHML